MRLQINTLVLFLLGLYFNPYSFSIQTKGAIFLRESEGSKYFMFGDGTVGEVDTILSWGLLYLWSINMKNIQVG